ncbi:MAG: NADH:flavin oxidoreductase, partial [Candidatus Latescibacteria bacterium]|nr:NADH:flavin oxidoreductase [Candidatus Latescibacterota bacterium]
RKDGIIITKMHRLDDDTYIEGMALLFKAIKDQDSVPCVQLFHAGRKSLSAFTGVQPIAPSPIPHPNYKDIPRELSVDEIHELVSCFGQAARRAKKAGAQMIEMHGAHGYLICQFLSPFSNKRRDVYGGSTENRTRFLCEILLAVRSNVGKKYPICCRISADEYIESGLTVEESTYIAQILADSGANIISVSAGIDSDVWAPGKDDGRRCYAHLSRKIKEAVKVPVISVGNILDINDAEIVLQYGDADMAAMGRELIADPYLVKKTVQGQTAQIDGCIQCRNCLVSLVESHMTCTVNSNL